MTPEQKEYDLPEKEPAKQETLTPELATKIFIQSFRHSQGNPQLQRDLFCYFHLKHPDWKIDPVFKGKLHDSCTAAIYKLLPFKGGEEEVDDAKRRSMHRRVTTTLASGSISEQLVRIESIFNSGILSTVDGVSLDIIVKILFRDHAYFSRGGRKDIVAEHSPLSPYTNSHLSYFCYYGLEAHSTGLPDLDGMYQEGVSRILEVIDKLPIEKRSMVTEVIQQYYQYHPELVVPKNAQLLLVKAKATTK